MRLALVANPASGRGVDVESALGAGLVVGPGELERVAAFAPARVAVAGGDGTIAAVAALCARLAVPLAVIPTGTANDFARAAGLPLDVARAVRLARTGTSLRAFELGRLSDGRPFVNVASAGLASVAARRAEPLKSRFGPFAYALGAARAAVGGQPLEVAVRVDGAPVFSGPAWQVIVACTGAFGGGSGIGAADATDGELDVVVLPAGSRASLARRAWGLRTRTIERQRAVPHFAGRDVAVDLPPGTELNVDGELARGGLDHVTARAAAFELVVG